MGREVRAILAEMRAIRRERFAELARTPAERLDAMTEWSRVPHDARFVLLHLANHEEEHTLHLDRLLHAAGYRQTTAQQLLGAAERTRGDLLGALVGLDDSDLDLTPPGEWPLRRILHHIITTEERYLAHARYAVERFDAGLPWEPPAEGVVPAYGEETPDGPFAEIVAALDEARERVIAQLGGLTDAQLKAPTVWANHAVDVDFRLRRFAAHEREHTAHILKWRRQVGREQSEAEYLLALAWRERGMLHALLAGIDDAWLDREINPDMPEMTLRWLLRHIIGSEGYLMGQVTKAV